MDINHRINAFSQLGDKLRVQDSIPSEILFRAEQQNNWFTAENIRLAIESLSLLLNKDRLTQWVAAYEFSNSSPKSIGVIMAGNIPLVGFTDFLAIIISGHVAKMKLSSQDNVLLPFIVDLLLEIEPKLAAQINFIERLKEVDAVIATGSDNTSRYFEYYFAKYPHIIRKNRTSCAVLNGKESPDEIHRLGLDIFRYYGLGCRNVSKVYFPKDYNIESLLGNLNNHEGIAIHHKYHNNYDYNKSIYLVNLVHHYDNGFLLLTEDAALVSPISVLFYERYDDQAHLNELLGAHKDKIQCIVSKDGWYDGGLSLGEAQNPSLMDYADNVDVMAFLISLK
jgi:hypothetical protein